MGQVLSFNQAVEYLGIPRKHLDNYAKLGGELEYRREGIRYVIERDELDRWKAQRDFSMFQLDQEAYLKCLRFGLESFYKYPSTADFGSAVQRGAGKFVSDFVQGKLGELAFKRFAAERFRLDVRLDFTVRGEIVGQDIVEVARLDRRPRVYNPPRLRVSIKTTKWKNVWLIVPQSELEDRVRRSDVYVLARVDLYLNHLFRLLRNHSALANSQIPIPEFEPLDAQIVGFANKEELLAHPPVTEIPGSQIKSSYARRSGDLNCTPQAWEQLLSRL